MAHAVFLKEWELREHDLILASINAEIEKNKEKAKALAADEKKGAQDLSEKEKELKKAQVELKRLIQEKEPAVKELQSELSREKRRYDEERMDSQMEEMTLHNSVSYTHLTLPTILRV